MDLAMRSLRSAVRRARPGSRYHLVELSPCPQMRTSETQDGASFRRLPARSSRSCEMRSRRGRTLMGRRLAPLALSTPEFERRQAPIPDVINSHQNSSGNPQPSSISPGAP